MFSSVWNRIVNHEGEVFSQIRGQKFTYKVIGKSVVPSTTNRKIPMSHFEKNYKLIPLENTTPLQKLQGPSYLYAILMDDRIKVC